MNAVFKTAQEHFLAYYTQKHLMLYVILNDLLRTYSTFCNIFLVVLSGFRMSFVADIGDLFEH